MKKPVHPGQILKQKIDELNLSVMEFTSHMKTSSSQLFYIISGKRVRGSNKKMYDIRITTKLALKLADALKTTPQFWLELQMNYDVYQALKTHKKIKPVKAKVK